MKPCKKHPDGERGAGGRCKDCNRESMAKERSISPEIQRERCARYRAANPEKVRASRAKYRAANPEKVRAGSAKYSSSHREIRRSINADYNWRKKHAITLPESERPIPPTPSEIEEALK